MENEIICLDTSVLIDYFRKKNKKNSFLFQLSKKYSNFSISVVTEYEIYSGSNDIQDVFWNDLLQSFTIFSFNSKVNAIAVEIYKQMKKSRNLIDVPDIWIGATAIENNIKLATLNVKHFNRIENLELITNEKDHND